jgi:hypothetical protein
MTEARKFTEAAEAASPGFADSILDTISTHYYTKIHAAKQDPRLAH